MGEGICSKGAYTIVSLWKCTVIFHFANDSEQCQKCYMWHLVGVVHHCWAPLWGSKFRNAFSQGIPKAIFIWNTHILHKMTKNMVDVWTPPLGSSDSFTCNMVPFFGECPNSETAFKKRYTCLAWKNQWKALKCQTLGTAVHVIVLVCWLETEHCLVTLSCLPCALFCSCPCKVRSWVSDVLSQALCNLFLALLADFTLSDSTAPICFIVKLFSLSNYTLLFVWIDRHDYSVHMSSVLQVQQLYNAGIPLLGGILPTANNQTRKERLSQNKMATSNVVEGSKVDHVTDPEGMHVNYNTESMR